MTNQMLRLVAALFLLLTAAACVTRPDPSARSASIDLGVREAFLFAFPVYQMARTRAEAIHNADRDGRTIVNRFGHRSRLSGPEDRLVTTPNNDTLYSAAWLDLTAGPAILTVPALPDRYHSVALMDIFTDHFAVLGTREQQGLGGSLLVTGPGWSGSVPAGMTEIKAPTNDAWAIVRVLVDGPDDLAAAVAAQRKFVIEPLDRVCRDDLPSVPSRSPNPEEMLRTVNAMLAGNPLPPDRAKAASGLDIYGVGPMAPAWDDLAPAVRESWTGQLPALIDSLREGFAGVGTVRNGWSYPQPGMGNYGSDEFYRAAVALGGLAALPSAEASYLTATVDAGGRPLDGSRRYTLTIPAHVPVKSFWSLSIYELDSDGRLFFTPNPLGRYAVGSRTSGLLRNRDGSMTVVIQADAPRDNRANWLPSPPGPFRLTFRGYLPEPEFLSGAFLLDPLQPISPQQID